MAFIRLSTLALLLLGITTMAQGCWFAAGAVTGAAATEAAEEADDDE